jgi:hypothetical protein
MTPVQDLLANLKLAEPVASRSLFAWPLFMDGGATTPPILTLEEALAQKLADVSEISESGSVPYLLVANRSEQMLFLLDGEQVIGAKQNRTFNISMLIPPASQVKVPVSCLEQGRWRMAAERVHSAEHAHFAQGRARKMRSVSNSLVNEGSFLSDQREVWADVSARIRRTSASSATMAEADYFRTGRSETNSAAERFTAAPNQAGSVFGIGGRIVGIEIFSSPAMFGKLAPKTVRSYLLDAIETYATADPGVRQAVEALLATSSNSKLHAFAAPGVGDSLRFGGDHLTGAALVHSHRCIHLAAFCNL